MNENRCAIHQNVLAFSPVGEILVLRECAFCFIKACFGVEPEPWLAEALSRIDTNAISHPMKHPTNPGSH